MPLPRTHDELRDLAQAINDMARQLADLQADLQQSERNRLHAQLSSGLAHQLRNQATGARLAVQLARSEAASEELDVALRQLTMMEVSLRRFLDRGPLDSIRREPCLLADLIDEAVQLYRPQCQHARIRLAWQRPPGEVTLPGDRDRLHHLIVNLLGNAIDAAGPDGQVEIALEPTDAAICLRVCDSGPGPPAAIADRLFEPFVTGKSEGIGLGLAVVQEAVQAHAGRIDWNREGGQTCFRVWLPRGGKLAEGELQRA
jgi:signal transduction histidine kinase